MTAEIWRPDERLRARDGEFRRAALAAAQQSYSPYSRFPVGACVVWADPLGQGLRTSLGCNVENCFYEAGHAEQVAVLAGAASGYRRLLAAYVVCLAPPAAAALPSLLPCGFCRQWMAEFVPDGADAEVVIVGRQGNVRQRLRLIADLLPQPFRWQP